MANVLVIAELADGKVRNATLSAITAARTAAAALGGVYSILVIGPGACTAAQQVTAYGASAVLAADLPGAGYLCETYCPTVAEVAKDFGLILATATSFGKDLLPRLAARLDAGYAADVASIQGTGGKLSYRRPMFAGNVYGTAEITTAIQVASIRQSEFAPAAPAQGSSPIQPVAVQPPGPGADRIKFLAFDQVQSARPELTDAKTIVSGGRALKEKFDVVLSPLADVLGAAIGATRAACDAGYAPNDLQVGQTGKIVAPDLYLAFGISGAIQHVAGMKGSRVIVAVNKDPEAPIFQVADYGLVADLFAVVPELIERIKACKG